MKMRAERYQHVKTVVSEVHDGLLAWCRRVLREAGLETIEVYGQFPPEGATSSSQCAPVCTLSSSPLLSSCPATSAEAGAPTPLGRRQKQITGTAGGSESRGPAR